MATDLLTTIEYEMVKKIEGMTEGLYHFNWDSCNQLDVAKMEFPNAQIYLENENCLDSASGSNNQAYFQEVTFRIEVLARLEEECDNPRFDINVELNKALSDLKRVFGSDYSVNGSVDTIMYTGSNREYIRNNDIFIPAKLITRWNVRYEQDRSDPDVFA